MRATGVRDRSRAIGPIKEMLTSAPEAAVEADSAPSCRFMLRLPKSSRRAPRRCPAKRKHPATRIVVDLDASAP